MTTRGTSSSWRWVQKLMLAAVLALAGASGAWAKDWTILVYMEADNDLTPYALENIYAMEAAWNDGNFAGSTAKTDLVLELDTEGSTARKRIHVEQSAEEFHPLTPQELRARTEKDIHSPIVETLDKPKDPKDDKSQRELLEDFLTWGSKTYPARHYMVITWGHGQGWAPRHSSHAVKTWGGLEFDETAGTKLDTPALHHALAAMVAQIGHPIDVYASDACLMQSVEVTSEISDDTSYIVGTDTTESYVGLPYRRILSEINRGTFAGVQKEGETSEALWIARMIPALYQASMQPGQDGNELDPEAAQFLISSAIDSQALQAKLVPALESLGNALKSYVVEQPLRAIDLRGMTRSAVEFEGDSLDLGVFLSLLKSDLDRENAQDSGELSAALDTTSAALAGALVGTVAGSRYLGATPSPIPAGSVRGISLWVPTSQADYEARAKDFSGSLFYQGGQGWQSWIEAVYEPKNVAYN